MFLFRSVSPYLSVPGKPYETRQVTQGQVVVVNVTPTFEFKNHIFTTNDPDVAEYLRKKSGWVGRFYVEDQRGLVHADAKISEKDEVAEPEKVEGVKSKNAAIAYLVKEKGVDPESLKGVSAADLKVVALTKHKVNFVEWE